MKKLTMICMITLVVLAAGQAFALPGVYKAGATPITMATGMCRTRTISLDGTGFGTSPLMSGGFLLQNDNEWAVDITSCDCSAAIGSPFDQPVTPVFDPFGFPGGVFVAAANLGAGVTPSANIVICTVTFCGVGGGGTATITIDTVPDFDTWIAQDFTVYDPTIDAAVISVSVCPCPCECGISSGPFEVQANVSGDPVTAIYTARSTEDFCKNPSIYAYSDDCAQGTIDPATGVLIVPPFLSPPEEICTITVTDTANTYINTGDPIVCTQDIIILAGTCECEGNFDNDQDVDGFDAATFKADFSRGGFIRPCVNGDPCNGDFSCDGDVDGSDASLFKSDFGRGQFNNPCPSCPRDPWCVYP